MADITSSTYTVTDTSVNGDLYAIVRGGRLKKATISGLAAYMTNEAVNELRQGGPTTKRPSAASPYTMYFDETLNQPIWWNGLEWVDATGAGV